MTKTKYKVVDGVSHINGEPVPTNRVVALENGAEKYDLAMGRLSLFTPPRKQNKSGNPETDGAEQVEAGND